VWDASIDHKLSFATGITGGGAAAAGAAAAGAGGGAAAAAAAAAAAGDCFGWDSFVTFPVLLRLTRRTINSIRDCSFGGPRTIGKGEFRVVRIYRFAYFFCHSTRKQASWKATSPFPHSLLYRPHLCPPSEFALLPAPL